MGLYNKIAISFSILILVVTFICLLLLPTISILSLPILWLSLANIFAYLTLTMSLLSIIFNKYNVNGQIQIPEISITRVDVASFLSIAITVICLIIFTVMHIMH